MESLVGVVKPASRKEVLWYILVLLLLGIGLYGAAMSIFRPHHEVFGISSRFPLGLMLSAYVYFASAATGLCILSAFGHLFGVRPLEPFARRAVYMDIVFLLGGFSVLALELEHTFRLLCWLPRTPHFTSPILWMGLLYSFYLFFIILEFIAMLYGKETLSKLLAALAFISAVGATSNLGGVFGSLASRPYWYGPYMPVYILLTSLASGAAALLLAGIAAKEDERSIEYLASLFCLFLGLFIFLEAWRFIIPFYTKPPVPYKVTMAFLKGPYARSFWLFDVFMALIIPFALMIIPSFRRNKGAIVLASLVHLIGMVFSRYHIVIAGQLTPLRHYPDVKNFVPYTPTAVEWACVIGGAGVVLLLYTLGDKIFPLSDREV